MSFSFSLQTSDGTTELQLAGIIDEQADFKNIQLPATKKLVINMQEIKLLNSVGLRTWVLWAKSLQDIPIIALRNCPSVVVHQMNVLDGFIPLQAVVESFEVPYHCESCGHSDSLWAVRGKHYFEKTADAPLRVEIPEARPCSSCGESMAVDVIPRKYFHFLNLRK